METSTIEYRFPNNEHSSIHGDDPTSEPYVPCITIYKIAFKLIGIHFPSNAFSSLLALKG